MSLPVLNLGVLGLGRAFSLMLPSFLGDSRVRLVAACDPRAAARARFTADFQAPAYESAEALMANADVQAVYIASPHQHHAEHTRLAAARGKHVLVEKPMALSLPECDAMIAACAAASVHLVIGHCHSFDTPYLQCRERIARGEFGAVKMVHALNYTDYLFRPRRPEELATHEGGGAVFSQAAHQVDIVRMLVGRRPTRLRCALGNWDPARPTEGAYSALLWFDGGAYAALNYNGYAHFDSDEWMGWVGEMGQAKDPADYGAARRRLAGMAGRQAEASLKAASTYGGARYTPPSPADAPPRALHQHFGPIVVSCERADLRPLPTGILVYGHDRQDFLPLAPPPAPRLEVIGELYDAIFRGRPALHDGNWAKATLEICLGMLESHRTSTDVHFLHQP